MIVELYNSFHGHHGWLEHVCDNNTFVPDETFIDSLVVMVPLADSCILVHCHLNLYLHFINGDLTTTITLFIRVRVMGHDEGEGNRWI